MTVLLQRLNIETNFEDVKSIYCKQNTEVTGRTYDQCLEQLEGKPRANSSQG